jgi:hypothetical protein
LLGWKKLRLLSQNVSSSILEMNTAYGSDSLDMLSLRIVYNVQTIT